MPPDPEIRASDADRDRVAAGLREHCAEGRLTLDELNERLEATYAAKTLGELWQLTADLPEEDMYQLPVPARHRPVPARRGGTPDRLGAAAAAMTGMRAHWAAWATANTLVFMIWLIIFVTAGATYPWFLWVAGPWGAVLLARQLLGRSGGSGHSGGSGGPGRA
jgi:hypothetical protein